jgi:hypothetical protein
MHNDTKGSDHVYYKQHAFVKASGMHVHGACTAWHAHARAAQSLSKAAAGQVVGNAQTGDPATLADVP